MKNKRYVLFDLDGTLTDPKIGITKSVQYSLKTFGIQIDDTDSLTNFIGPPLRDSYKKFYGFNDTEAEEAVAKYREYYAETGIFENTVYAGVDVLLKTLADAGKKLILATSKPTVYAEKILRHFDIHRYFCFISGSELDGRRSKKAEVIQYALDGMGITELNEAVMAGDREHDIIGAHEVGIAGVGVLYGYGDFNELKNAGAAAIVESVDALRELLCEN